MKKQFEVNPEKAQLIQDALKELENETLSELSAEFINGGEWVKVTTKIVFKSDSHIME